MAEAGVTFGNGGICVAPGCPAARRRKGRGPETARKSVENLLDAASATTSGARLAAGKPGQRCMPMGVTMRRSVTRDRNVG